MNVYNVGICIDGVSNTKIVLSESIIVAIAKVKMFYEVNPDKNIGQYEIFSVKQIETIDIE